MILIGWNKNIHRKMLFFLCVYIKWLKKLQKKRGQNTVFKHLFIITKKKKKKEFWHKMSHIETQLEHSNIVLKRTRKYCGKKNKRHYRKRKTKI